MNTISEGQHIELTKAVMDLLDDWGLSATDIINVLGLPSKTRTRHLQRYRDNTPLPRDEQTMFRIEHLVGIADALRTSFPLNSRIGLIWLRRPHRRLSQRTPLDMMLQDGIKGLCSVRAELDCAYSWEHSVN